MSREKIIVVDKDNIVVGSKFRDEMDYTTDIYRSTAIWITNSKKEMLIAQRSFNMGGDPGKWGPAAAGTVGESETYESNVYKELEEELGISGVELTAGAISFIGKPRMQFVKRYTGVLDVQIKDLILQETEVETARWITIEDLIAEVTTNPSKYVPMMSVGLKELGLM